MSIRQDETRGSEFEDGFSKSRKWDQVIDIEEWASLLIFLLFKITFRRRDWDEILIQEARPISIQSFEILNILESLDPAVGQKRRSIWTTTFPLKMNDYLGKYFVSLLYNPERLTGFLLYEQLLSAIFKFNFEGNKKTTLF